MQKNSRKINSLTSLRFFAAFMVMALHTNGTFLSIPALGGLVLQLGVSVFFVLSGFILTYVYPQLNVKDIGPFLRARIARIWPAHFAALILACIVMHEFVQLGPNRYYFLISATMVNSWIPFESYFMKFNQPAWSIATEFFFYLCFPLLIYRMTNNWYIKLAATLVTTILIITVCDKFNLPDTSGTSVSKLSLVYYNPWCRILEFIMGMCTALLYRRISHINFNFVLVSVLEIVAIMLMVLSFKNYYPWYQEPFNTISPTANLWLSLSGGSSPFIAAVILVLALQKGIVNKILSLALFVSLGEISYSLYLVHNIFLSYYGAHPTQFVDMSYALRCLVYWTVTFSTAYLMWRFVEVPGRKLICNFSLKNLRSSKLALDAGTTT